MYDDRRGADSQSPRLSYVFSIIEAQAPINTIKHAASGDPSFEMPKPSNKHMKCRLAGRDCFCLLVKLLELHLQLIHIGRRFDRGPHMDIFVLNELDE